MYNDKAQYVQHIYIYTVYVCTCNLLVDLIITATRWWH